MKVQQSDIVLLPVPFSDQTTQKIRPAIVISNNKINNSSEDVILVPLTSVLKDVPYSVFINQECLSDGKLLVPSRARIDKPFTVHHSLIKAKIGTIKAEILTVIKKEIGKIV